MRNVLRSIVGNQKGWRLIPFVVVAIAVGVLAGVVYAQLGDTQTASGSVNVATSASADLYICEPGDIPGPECGEDDSGEDEAIFESVENMLPGDQVQWDIRLKNTGTEDWIISDARVTVVETVDPGNDCRNNALGTGRTTNGSSNAGTTDGVFILGKDGDAANDNPFFPADSPVIYWSPQVAILLSSLRRVTMKM